MADDGKSGEHTLVVVGDAAGETPLHLLGTDELKAEVQRLVASVAENWRHTIADAAHLGRALIALKSRLGHQFWTPYVEAELPFGIRQAQYLMTLAQADAQFISSLPVGTSVTEAIKLLTEQQRRAKGPRRLPEQGEGEGDDEGEPVPRYMIDVPTHEVVGAILDICFPDASTALDVTYGNGNFWGAEAPITLTAHDFDEDRAPNGSMDFRHLDYPDEHFDVVLFDPPHLVLGEGSVYAERFRTATASDLVKAWLQGTQEAWRVCSLGIVVKATDHVYGQRFVAMTDYIRDAMDYQAPYEVVHQVRTRPFIDPKWLRPQLSVINNGSTYLVWRKGDVRHIPR